MLGPIFSAELVTGARRTRYFVVRVIYGLVLLAALGIVYQGHFSHGRTADVHAAAMFAASYFASFTWIQVLAVLFLTPAIAAGAIALERERRTIEYLFVSHLTDAEIVFGKLGARLVQIACLVLVGLPILLLAGLMGGIAPEALVLAFLMTLSTVLVVAIVSIAISVWSARARDAVMRAYLVLLAAIVVPLVVEGTIGRGGGWLWDAVAGPVNRELLAANPLWLLGNDVLDDASSTTARAGAAWAMLLVLVRNHAIVAGACLAAATLAVRRVHIGARSKGARQPRFRWTQWLRPGCGDRPMMWKEVFADPAIARLGIAGRIAAALIALAVVGPTIWWFLDAVQRASWGPSSRDYLWVPITVTTLVGAGGLLLVAARAATAITSEKERDTWDSLLSTPLEPSAIVAAKVLGSIYAIRGVFLLLGFVWILTLLIEPGFLVAEFFTLATLLLLCFTVSAMGVLYSLRCRNSLRAMAATITTGLVVAGGYLFCCIPAMFASGPGDGGQIILAPCAPFLLVFPSVLYCEGEQMMRHEPAFLVAYVLGVIGYIVTASLLYAAAVGNFDCLSGRSGPGVPIPRRPRPAPPVIVVPEVVEEGDPVPKPGVTDDRLRCPGDAP